MKGNQIIKPTSKNTVLASLLFKGATKGGTKGVEAPPLAKSKI